MSDDNSKGDKPSEIARNIWLAGLGAYGRAIKDAQGRLEEAAKEPPRLFRELVEKGSRLEDDVRESLSSIRKSGSMTVEERINRVRETFNLSLGRDDDLAAVHAKLDALNDKLDALTAQLAGAPASSRKRAPAKQARAAAAKGAAKKAPGRKTARKPAAKASAKTAKKATTRKRR
jgi:hypothetical protein